MPLLPDLKYLSLTPTTDTDTVYVTTKEEVLGYVSKLRPKLVDSVGNALEKNEIKRKEKVSNLVFIQEFEIEQIVTAYNYVVALRDKRIDKATFAIKFGVPFLLGLKPISEKVPTEYQKTILNIIGFL